jgi:hypothetical protein
MSFVRYFDHIYYNVCATLINNCKINCLERKKKKKKKKRKKKLKNQSPGQPSLITPTETTYNDLSETTTHFRRYFGH